MPSPDPVLSPHRVVKSGLCIGCGACAAQARMAGARMDLDLYGQLKPAGPAAWRGRPTAATARTCPFSPSAANEDELSIERYHHAAHADGRIGRYQCAYVGHVAEQDFRRQGSSGGLVSWTAVELLRRGLIDGVAHVVAEETAPGERLFRYRISRTEAEIRRGAKSRYYPVELSEVIGEIRSRPGRYAVIGCDAEIGAAFYGTGGGAALRNVDGSFYDFTAHHFTGVTRRKLATPHDDWGGRAAHDWARRLRPGNTSTPQPIASWTSPRCRTASTGAE